MPYIPPIEPDPREEKLPRWARELLGNMRLRVEHAERDAQQALLATRPDETDTVVYRYGDEPIGLTPGATVQFQLGPNERKHSYNYIQCRVETDTTGTYLHVIGGGALSFRPKSSNHAHIITER